MKFVPLVLGVLCALPHAHAHAGDGDLDPSFGVNGKQWIGFDLTKSGYDSLFGLGVAPDGKIYVAGSTQMPGDLSGIAIAKMHASGEIDTTFGKNGKVYGPEYQNIETLDLAVLADGDILIAGYILIGDEIETNRHDFIVCRFSSTGVADVDFGSADAAPGCVQIDNDYHDTANDILVQKDGKIVISGFSHVNSFLDPVTRPRGVMVRLSSDGIMDPNFGDGGLVAMPAEQPAGIGSMLQDAQEASNGDLVATGETLPPQDHPASADWRVYRLDSQGKFVPDFGDEGIAKVAFDLGDYRADYPRAVRILRNGAIAIGGYAMVNPTETRMAVSLLTEHGELDTAFGEGGKRTYSPCATPCSANFEDMVAQTDGKIILAGSSAGGSTARDFSILRIMSDGEIDSSFGQLGWSIVDFGLGGPISFDRAHRVVLHGGRALAAGYAYHQDHGNDMAVVRLKSDLIFTDNHEQ